MDSPLEKRKRWLYMAVMIFAAVGGVLYGYDLGVIAGALLFVPHDIPMTVQQISFLVGAYLFGGAVATLLSGPLADWLGRKLLIMLSSVIFLIGVLLVVIADTYSTLLMGRVIQGVGVGIITIVVPLFLSESLPTYLRGRGIAIFQLLLTAGILLAGVVDVLFVTSGNWRGMFIMSAIPGVIMFLGCFFLDNSPRWLVMKNRDKEALTVLEKSRTKEVALAELEEIQKLRMLGDYNATHFQFETFFQKRFFIPFLIVLGVAALNQLIAVNSILQLGPTILKDMGFESDWSAMLGSTAVMGLNFLVTLLVVGFVDKIERKVLYGVGTGGLALALIYCGFITHYLPSGAEKGYLLLAGLLAFILFYSMGPGLLVWVVLAELLPLKIRSSGMALALCTNSLISAVWSSIFLDVADKFGYDKVFWLCGLFGVLYCLLVSLKIPKVKGRSLEEIEAGFAE
jgi:SP family galactose:H+ symporter-like MFS transporter